MSPMTVKVERNRMPTAPLNTWPRLTPMRTGRMPVASAMRRTVLQHPALVVLAGGRDAGGQDELAAVLVDVGGEEGDQLLVHRGLDDGDEAVECGGGRVRPFLLHDPVDAREAHEADGGGPVLGLHRAVAEVGAQAHRDALGDGFGRDGAGGDGAGRGPPGLPPPQPPPGPLWRSAAPGPSRARVAALTTISPGPAACSITVVVVAAGPAMTSSRCDRPARKSWTSPLWMPTDMRSGTVPTEVGIVAASRSAARISTAALAACPAWSSPRNSSRRASPPNLTREPVRS